MQQDRLRRCRLGPLVAVLFVLFALGCAPKNYYPSGGYGGGGGGEFGVESEYEYSDDLDYGDATVAEAPAREPREERERGARFKSKKDAAASPGPSSATGSTSTVEPEPPLPPEPDEQPVPSHGRQIVYTAGMGLSVFEVDDVMAKLEAIPERHGGWLQQRLDNSVMLRVPAAKLDLIIDEISQWGVVEYKTLEALDVTAEYTDLDSRIRTLEQMQKHLQELLERAENVEQALEIQMELSRVTTELEMLRAQMRMLESSIAFSTLAVHLRERGTTAPEPGDDPFPWVDELGAEATGYR